MALLMRPDAPAHQALGCRLVSVPCLIVISGSRFAFCREPGVVSIFACLEARKLLSASRHRAVRRRPCAATTALAYPPGNRFLPANGFGFSLSVNRIGTPGRANASRSALTRYRR